MSEETQLTFIEIKWVKVEDEEPPPARMVLIWCGTYDSVACCCFGSNYWKARQPTHWMYLPEPPFKIADAP